MHFSPCAVSSWNLRASFKAAQPASSPACRFVDIASAAGIRHKTIFGGEDRNTYLLETTGSGVAFFDFDNDGWLDLFFVNGSRLEGFAKEPNPTNHLYQNNRDGTFTDVTEKAGLIRSGWGQGVCVGDYENDGNEDLFVTYWEKMSFTGTSGRWEVCRCIREGWCRRVRTRWGTGCAFVDYDRDGFLDLFVANYVDFDIKTAPLPKSGGCTYKGVLIACGPAGLPGGKNILYHNNRDGTFSDVSEKSGITQASGTYSLGVVTSDFNNDGWPEIYVANDSQPSALYRNNRDGTFKDIGIVAGCAYSQDGKSQAGMGVAAGDFDGDGWMDIFKTNFSEDTPNLYRNTGAAVFDEVTFIAGLGLNTRYLGWACGFLDLDNDGWLDIFLVNGHIYPRDRTARRSISVIANERSFITTWVAGVFRTSRVTSVRLSLRETPLEGPLLAILTMTAISTSRSIRSTATLNYCGAIPPHRPGAEITGSRFEPSAPARIAAASGQESSALQETGSRWMRSEAVQPTCPKTICGCTAV